MMIPGQLRSRTQLCTYATHSIHLMVYMAPSFFPQFCLPFSLFSPSTPLTQFLHTHIHTHTHTHTHTHSHTGYGFQDLLPTREEMLPIPHCPLCNLFPKQIRYPAWGYKSNCKVSWALF